MSTSKTDEPTRPMTVDDILAVAGSDPDARPLTSRDFQRMRETPRVGIIRRALRLGSEEFAVRYGIPLKVIEDWESRATIPDDVAISYLRAIAADPDGVADALADRKACWKPG